MHRVSLPAHIESLEHRQLLSSTPTITRFEYNGHALKDGMTIDLAKLNSSRVLIRAVTSGSVQSVKFSGDVIDNHAHYTTTRSGLGSHVITAEAYSNDNAKGRHGKSKKIHFKLIDSRLSSPAINSASVIDEATGNSLAPISEGATIDPFSLPTTDIGIGAAANSATQSVSFNLDGSSAFDSSSPFSTADLDKTLITPGAHTLVITPFKGTVAGTVKTIHFTTAAPAPAVPQIASLSLVDASTDSVIRALTQNDTISLHEFGTGGAFIRANIDGTAGLVQFHLDSSQSLDLDLTAPFQTGGPGSDEFAVGTHTLTIRAFSGSSNGSGGGDPFVFNYTVTAPVPI